MRKAVKMPNKITSRIQKQYPISLIHPAPPWIGYGKLTKHDWIVPVPGDGVRSGNEYMGQSSQHTHNYGEP